MRFTHLVFRGTAGAFGAVRVGVRQVLLVVAVGLATLFVLSAGPAVAHGFTSVVYAKVTSAQENHVEVALGLEYDLLLVSVAAEEDDDPFYREGQPAWEEGNYPGMIKAVQDHRASVLAYLAEHLTMRTAAGAVCTPTMDEAVAVDMHEALQVPYASVRLDYACPAMGPTEHGHVLRSTLFPASEGFVKETKTLVTYEVDGRSGSAALDEAHPSFSTGQTWYQRFWEFFRLGAEHLYGGIDHLLFLLALIAGSRRLREVVLAATAFTLAHSLTFILAALGVVSPPARLVEPAIALSIAAVGGWHVWRLWRYRGRASQIDTTSRSHFALDRAGWFRLAIVFGFGLVHGLGFAGALGITSSFSWTLLWSLVVFNVGIEAVQIGIIVAAFPLLAWLRTRKGPLHVWVTGVIAAGVSVMGLIWFVQRAWSR
jgi:hypothetical protein